MLHQLWQVNVSRLSVVLLSALVIGQGILSSGCQAKSHSGGKEQAAEERLDNLLGKAETNPTEIVPSLPHGQPNAEKMTPQSPSQQDDAFGAFPSWAKNMLPGQPDIQVQEERQNYRISVGLSNPKDANSVRINVLPHRVEVSGQSSFGKDGMEGSSSFFKSFTTSSELLPNEMKRMQNQQSLEFIIPKKVASDPIKQSDNQPLPSKSTQPVPSNLSPDVLEQLDNSQSRPI